MEQIQRHTSRMADKSTTPRWGHRKQNDASIGSIIARRIPALTGAIGLDMVSTQLAVNAGATEVGPGNILFSALNKISPANILSPQSLMFHGMELGIAVTAAYTLGHVWGSKEENNFAAKWFTNGAIALITLIGVNNVWNAAYYHGMLPIAGPLTQGINLMLNGILNILDIIAPESGAK